MGGLKPVARGRSCGPGPLRLARVAGNGASRGNGSFASLARFGRRATVPVVARQASRHAVGEAPDALDRVGALEARLAALGSELTRLRERVAQLEARSAAPSSDSTATAAAARAEAPTPKRPAAVAAPSFVSLAGR